MQQRRLAAIMFTDIVGYTSMMGKDEKKAFDFLKKNRRIQWRLIKKFRGRWLKEMGDGILASFSSNIDAVMCALSIQRAAVEMEIPLRIGIHQGDVIFEKRDVLGDGVNIASRIQGFADKNGIVISQTVYNDIKNKEGLEVSKMGDQPLKGVADPVGIYKVICQDANILDFKIDTGELIRPLGFGRAALVISVLIIAIFAFAAYYFLPILNNTKTGLGNSIVVLPFDNYIGSDTLEYFVSGMHSSLIGDLGKISALQVKSKTTANAYKDIDKSIPEIADELGVNILVEGSVMCLGDTVCLQIKLLSAYPEEQTLWVQDYYEERSQILSLYNKVTKEISEEINVILTPEEERRLADARTVNTEVYDLYLKSHVYWEQLSKDALIRAKEYLELAIEKDPDWAPLYAGLAKVWLGFGQMGHVSPEIVMPNLYENLNKAIELDPDYAGSYFTNGVIGIWVEWNWEKGEQSLLKALELNPNDVLSRIYYAHLLMMLGNIGEAIEQGNIALELDPLNPLIQTLYAVILIEKHDYNIALDYCEKAYAADPSNTLSSWILFYTSYLTGNYETSFEAGLNLFPLDVDEKFIAEKTFRDKGYFIALEEIYNILEQSDKEGYVMPYLMAMICLLLDDSEKVLEWLERGYELHDQNMPYTYNDFGDYKPIMNDPRFIELMEKMNLPHN